VSPRAHLWPLLTLASLLACKEAPPAPILDDAPETCQSCHAAVFAEWRQSMHARAHHEGDPLYAAFRQLRIGKEGLQLAPACAGCHSPRGVAEPDGALAQTGVACAACHQLEAVRPDAKGAKALIRGPAGTLRGPHDTPADVGAHKGGPALPPLADGKTVCLACHSELSTPGGTPLCSTGMEGPADSKATCVSCHMPEVAAPSGNLTQRKTHRSHAFPGPRGTWEDPEAFAAFMATAVDVQVSLPEPGTAEVTVRNRSDHAFPSGFPGRVGWIALHALDAQGAVTATLAMSMLDKRYVDAEGKPALPPYSARLEADNRIPGGGQTVLRAAVPGAPAALQAQVGLRLMPPPLAKMMHLEASPLAAPRVVKTVRFTPPPPSGAAPR
jgi:hypothetical protein